MKKLIAIALLSSLTAFAADTLPSTQNTTGSAPAASDQQAQLPPQQQDPRAQGLQQPSTTTTTTESQVRHDEKGNVDTRHTQSTDTQKRSE